MIEQEIGTVTFRIHNKKIQYLILFTTKSRYWEFPKGHIEANESEEQAVHRELFEETGLQGKIISGFSHKFSIQLPSKECRFANFIVELEQGKIVLEPTHETYRFVSFDEALQLFTFDNLKELIAKAHQFLLVRQKN